MGRRKGRKQTQNTLITPQEMGELVEEGGGEGGGEGARFFACYLLRSLSPRFKGHTYIGFTVNPRRRIRQHNGEIGCGAWRTKRKRPWEMVLCIYGFPTNVAALQFEWAWQHPVESLAVRSAAATLKSLSGIANKIKLAYTMLSLPAWNSLNLVVNFFSTKYKKHTSCCPTLPPQMRTQIGSMEELHCYNGNSGCGDDELDGDEDYDLTDSLQDSNEESLESMRKDNGSPSSQVGTFEGITKKQIIQKIGMSFESSYVEDDERIHILVEEFSPELDKRHVPTTFATHRDYLSICNPLTPCEVEVVDISTPSPCYLTNSGSKRRRPSAFTEIIDLTMSPMLV